MSNQPEGTTFRTRTERIALLRETLEELEQASSEMRSSLKESNAEQHSTMFTPVLDRLRRILVSERRGYTQFLADELAGVRSGIRRLRLPATDPELQAPTPALRALRSARGNLIEALDNTLEAAAELQMFPRDVLIDLPPLKRSEMRDALIRLDERLRQIEVGLDDFVGAERASNEGGPLSEATITDLYARKIEIEVDAARFETNIADRVSLTELTRAFTVLHEIGQGISNIIRDMNTKLSHLFQVKGRSLVNSISRGYQVFRTVMHRATLILVRSQSILPEKVTSRSESPDPHDQPQENDATLVSEHLPYLRQYAHALTGSQSQGDALVARTLEIIVREPDIIPASGAIRIAVFRVFSRVFADFSVVSEPNQPEHYDRPIARLVPLMAQAALLSRLQRFTDEEVALILAIDIDKVRELVNEAERELASHLTTDVLIIEDEPLIAMDLENLVEGLGHNVTGVGRTRAEAVKLAFTKQPGLILADIQLADGSSGVDAVADILKMFEVPVIFITAYPERFLMATQRPEPAFLIRKPFEPPTVTALITQILFAELSAPRSQAQRRQGKNV